MKDINERCFWLTDIRGQGGHAYYCDYDYEPFIKCKDCFYFVDIDDAKEIVKSCFEAFQRRS